MIYNLPIEPLPERYSGYWLNDVGKSFAREGATVTQVLGDEVSATINNGQFLDATGTLIWKTSQLNRMIRYIQAGEVQEGDVIFLHDIWYPGIEALFYARDGLGLKFKIAGMLHAGTYDPHDWTAQRGMGRWARQFENSWLHEVDMVFVASLFHSELVSEARQTNNNVKVLMSFPRAWDAQLAQAGRDALFQRRKKRLVVWPHRKAPEKDEATFLAAAKATTENWPGWQFVSSKDICKSKAQYYQLLLEASIAVSTAKQETWGIAMRESTIAGAVPLVPDSLSYCEAFDPVFMYPEGLDGLLDALHYTISTLEANDATSRHLEEKVERQAAGFEVLAKAAPMKMIHEMRRRGWKV